MWSEQVIRARTENARRGSIHGSVSFHGPLPTETRTVEEGRERFYVPIREVRESDLRSLRRAASNIADSRLDMVELSHRVPNEAVKELHDFIFEMESLSERINRLAQCIEDHPGLT